MSTSHGFWSVGIMAGSLLGAVLAALGSDPRWAIPLVASVVLPVALMVARALPAFAQVRPERQPHTERHPPPGWRLLGICLFVFGVTMTEGAMADWSAILLRDAMGGERGVVGLGYTVIALCVAAGRFGGDAMRSRFGPVFTARLCGALALAGIVLLFLSPTLVVALGGFGVVGLGVSVGFPLAVTAAARIGDRPAADNVAMLSFIALCGFLVGPPVIGLIAESAGIRLGLIALLPVLAVSLLLAGRLAAPPPATRRLPKDIESQTF